MYFRYRYRERLARAGCLLTVAEDTGQTPAPAEENPKEFKNLWGLKMPLTTQTVIQTAISLCALSASVVNRFCFPI